jgi:hypothetical protein
MGLGDGLFFADKPVSDTIAIRLCSFLTLRPRPDA